MDLTTFSPLRLLHYRGQEFAAEIEMEFRHHINLLIEQNEAIGMDRTTATRHALERFGPLDQLKKDCMKIRRHGSPALRLFKGFLSVVFVVGVVARLAGSGINEVQIANMLIAIPAACALLLYLRSKGRTSTMPIDGDPHPLGLAASEPG